MSFQKERTHGQIHLHACYSKRSPFISMKIAKVQKSALELRLLVIRCVCRIIEMRGLFYYCFNSSQIVKGHFNLQVSREIKHTIELYKNYVALHRLDTWESLLRVIKSNQNSLVFRAPPIGNRRICGAFEMRVRRICRIHTNRTLNQVAIMWIDDCSKWCVMFCRCCHPLSLLSYCSKLFLFGFIFQYALFYLGDPVHSFVCYSFAYNWFICLTPMLFHC